MSEVNDLRRWYERDLGCFAPWDKCVHVVGESASPEEHKLKIKIYTDTNSYQITAAERRNSRTDGYLGCIASSRKPRAGEDWSRGRDLPDGPLSEETWRKIVAAIVSYELVRVQVDRLQEEHKPFMGPARSTTIAAS